MEHFEINKDIRKAFTLPADFYLDPKIFEILKKKIFPSAWQWVGSTDAVKEPGSVYPFKLLEHFLNEPLLLTKTENGSVYCVSNVCTHRGNLLVHKAGKCNGLKCNYHGRRFSLEGKFEFMPGFEDAEDFPSPSDHLPQLPLFTFGKFLFTSLNPLVPAVHIFSEMIRRTGWMPFEKFVLDSTRSKDYHVDANWALYIDNALEGFHIPFVHPGLSKVLDHAQYQTELFEWSSLQIAIANPGEPVFDFPEGHPDFGKQVGGYYFWLFPNMMFNFYPWGLSINLVQPLSIDKTRVRYLTYVWRPELLEKGAGAALQNVEMEDEAVVQSVQLGINSSLYHQGRFSPSKEKGVHHFHRIIGRLLLNVEF